VVVNNQFGMGTALDRHSAVTDLSVKAAGFGVPGHRCDGMDVLDTHAVVGEAVRCAREERKPQLVEAVTYRFKGHSVADPEEYRSDEEVEEWKKRDPIQTFASGIEDLDFDALDKEVGTVVDEAVEFAEQSPYPELESIYEGLYA
jgi:pyruvate dehydrogenase E1 component alpha subunit